MSSQTTHTDCRNPSYVSVPFRSGWTALRIWVDPVRDEQARAIRDINRALAGELPCQCSECRTDQEEAGER